MSERKLIRGNLEDLAPNNSDKAMQARNQNPEDRPKLKPIVKGPVVKEKKSFFKKFKESFLGDSTNFGEMIMYDILVPALRGTLRDLGLGVVETFFGRGGRGNYDSRVVRDRGRTYISYNEVSSARERRDPDRGERARHDFDNIIFNSRGEANDVLAHLVDFTIEYGEATVGTFYELSNIDPNHTDYRYGWTNLRSAFVEQTRGGYIIRFPDVRPL